MFKSMQVKFPLKIYRFGATIEIRDAVNRIILRPNLTRGGNHYFNDIESILSAAVDNLNLIFEARGNLQDPKEVLESSEEEKEEIVSPAVEDTEIEEVENSKSENHVEKRKRGRPRKK